MKPSELSGQRIADPPDWRGQIFARLRQLVHQADPNLTEEWKWNTNDKILWMDIQVLMTVISFG